MPQGPPDEGGIFSVAAVLRKLCRHGAKKSDLYAELARALAPMTFARCVDYGDGPAVYEHFSENHLDTPPDILSRLGVMYPTRPDGTRAPHEHAFPNGWDPSEPLDLETSGRAEHL